MTTIATAGTTAEAVTLYVECDKLVKMLQQIVQGDRTCATPGRSTAAQVDTQIAAVQAAITAITA